MAFLTRASRHVAERAKIDLPDLDGVLSLTTISMLVFISEEEGLPSLC